MSKKSDVKPGLFAGLFGLLLVGGFGVWAVLT